MKLLSVFLFASLLALSLFSPASVEAIYYEEAAFYSFSYEGPSGELGQSKIVAVAGQGSGANIAEEEFLLTAIPTANGASWSQAEYVAANSSSTATLITVSCGGVAEIHDNTKTNVKRIISVSGSYNGGACDVVIGDNPDGQPTGSISYVVTINGLNTLIEEQGSAGPFTAALLRDGSPVSEITREYTSPQPNETVSFEFHNIVVGENYTIQLQRETGAVIDRSDPFTVEENTTVVPEPSPHVVSAAEFQNGIGADGEEVPDCNSSQGGALGWVMCAGVEAITDVVGWFATLIQQFLRVSPVVAQNADGSESSVHIAWNGIKNIALVVLVIAALIAVFGQSIGIEAYTVKKMLPRIIIASIATLLSFTLVAILVDAFNVLGEGIHDLMTSTIDLSIEVDFASFITTTLGLLVGGAAAGAAGILWVTTAGPGAAAGTIALFVLLPLLLAVLGVFFTLIFRQILIVLLIVVSPIAFVAWTLPNTERYFKLWYDTLIKALLMYPMIMLLIASGQIYASIITSGNNSGAANLLIALLALALPLFLIPFTFRFAGSAISGVSQWAKGMGAKGTQLAKGDPSDPQSRRNLLRDRRLENRSHFASNAGDEKQKGVKEFKRRAANLSTSKYLGGIPGIGASSKRQALAEAAALNRAQSTIESYAKSPNAKVLDAILFDGLSGPDVLDPNKVNEDGTMGGYVPAPPVSAQDAAMARELKKDPYTVSEVFAWGMNKYGGSERTVKEMMRQGRRLGMDPRDMNSAMKRPQPGKIGLGAIKHVATYNSPGNEVVYDWEVADSSSRAASVQKLMEDTDVSAYHLAQHKPISFEAMASFVTSDADVAFGHHQDGRWQARVDTMKEVAYGGYLVERDEETGEITGRSQASPETRAAAVQALNDMQAHAPDRYNYEPPVAPSRRSPTSNQSSRQGESGSSESNISPGGVILPTDEEVININRNKEDS